MSQSAYSSSSAEALRALGDLFSGDDASIYSNYEMTPEGPVEVRRGHVEANCEVEAWCGRAVQLSQVYVGERSSRYDITLYEEDDSVLGTWQFGTQVPSQRRSPEDLAGPRMAAPQAALFIVRNTVWLPTSVVPESI